MKILVNKPVQKQLILRLDEGDDVYLSLTQLVQELNIRCASFNAIGALKIAKVGFWENGDYEWKTGEDLWEVTALVGNVSLKEGKPFIHCHGTFSFHDGSILAGHVAEGCIVFPTLEVSMLVSEARLEREFDHKTKLWLLK